MELRQVSEPTGILHSGRLATGQSHEGAELEPQVFAATELRRRIVTGVAAALLAVVVLWIAFAAASMKPSRLDRALHLESHRFAFIHKGHA